MLHVVMDRHDQAWTTSVFQVQRRALSLHYPLITRFCSWQLVQHAATGQNSVPRLHTTDYPLLLLLIQRSEYMFPSLHDQPLDLLICSTVQTCVGLRLLPFDLH